MYVFLLGFGFKQIANVLEAHTVTYLEECISMYRREVSFNPNYKITHSHIRQWHDEMVAVNQQRRMLKKMQEDEQKENCTISHIPVDSPKSFVAAMSLNPFKMPMNYFLLVTS